MDSVGGAASAEYNATGVNDLVDNNSVNKVVATNMDNDDSVILTKTPEY